ncbi:MAG: cytochrome c oxidase subunit I [Candidatus Cyclobacteriaceae bacterium M3_2C_046]
MSAHQESFISKYVFSTDHKMISKQFLFTGIFWVVIGGFFSVIMRLQLGFPGMDLTWLKPLFGKWINDTGQLDPEFYLGMVTMHGTIMIFFVLTAGLSGTFANLLIPLQIGARDMASGLINMLSYWFFFVASLILLASFFVQTGPNAAGWTSYPPLSAMPQASLGSHTGVSMWIIAMAFFVASIALGGINYISTVINMRTRGLKFNRLPLTVWSLFFTAILGLLTFPVLLSGLLLLFFDSNFGTSFFLSNIYIGGEALPHLGGSPLLYQHLFWFLAHPEVYIVIMPAMGIISDVIAINARKPIFGYNLMVLSLFAITFLSVIVWAHHMFVSGMNPLLGSVFSLTSFIIAVPSSIKVFNWLTTLWRGNIKFTSAMLFSLGFVSFFIAGGLTGLWVANSPIDIQVHDTYFIVAHFHLVMGSAAIFGFATGVYHWFPKMFGRMMNEKLGYLHFWITFIGIYLIFFPMHYIGIAGFPRRYYSFTNFDAFSMFTDLNSFISIAAIATFAAQFIFLYNIFHSMFRGKKASQNPWRATTLEWTTPIVPGHGNWPGAIPTVFRWPYDFSKPGAKQDFIMQHVPFSETRDSNFPDENDKILSEEEEIKSADIKQKEE